MSAFSAILFYFVHYLIVIVVKTSGKFIYTNDYWEPGGVTIRCVIFYLMFVNVTIHSFMFLNSLFLSYSPTCLAILRLEMHQVERLPPVVKAKRRDSHSLGQHLLVQHFEHLCLMWFRFLLQQLQRFPFLHFRRYLQSCSNLISSLEL